MEKFRINGNSMLPLLKDGQEIIGIKITKDSDLKKFDILIFESDNKFLCHYYWKSFKNFETGEFDIIQTRPLNPITGFDYPVSISKVRAKVIGKKINFAFKLLINFLSLFKRH